MNRFKKKVKNIFCPSIIISVVLLILSVISLTFIFANGLNHSALSYLIYPFSAYALTINVIWILQKTGNVKKLLDRNILFHRYMTEMDFKAEVSLYLSFGINIFYSVYKAFAGVYYHSVWFGTVAYYYMILSAERFLLLKHIRRKQRDYIKEYKKYSFCGYLLLILTIALIGMSVYMIHDGKVTVYPGHIIYAAAGYTFYNFITAILNIIKYRKLKNPIYSASKIITLATALISIFSLQTAMFAAFGKDIIQQRQMNILTGFCIFAIIIAMALFMIMYGKHSIKKIQQKH